MTSNRSELTLADTVDYAEFAAMAGLGVASLRQYATAKATKDGFPKPVTAPHIRSPRFSRADAEAWTKARADSSAGRRRGRPPKAADDRIRFTPEQGAELKHKLEASKISVLSLANDLGFTRRAIVQRLEGISGWNKSELQAIAKKLNVPYKDLVAPAKQPTK
jgi:hypothetical protein